MQRSRAPDKKKLAGPPRKLSVRQERLLLKAARHFTVGRREFHRKKVNGKSGFEMKLKPLLCMP